MNKHKHLLVAFPLLLLSSAQAKMPHLQDGLDPQDDEFQIAGLCRQIPEMYRQTVNRQPTPTPIPQEQTATQAQQAEARAAERDRIEQLAAKAYARTQQQLEQNAQEKQKELQEAQQHTQEVQRDLNALHVAQYNNSALAVVEAVVAVGLITAGGVADLPDKSIKFSLAVLGASSALIYDAYRRFFKKHTELHDMIKEQQDELLAAQDTVRAKEFATKRRS